MCKTPLIPESGQVSLRREQFVCGTTRPVVTRSNLTWTLMVDEGVDVRNLAMKI